VLGQPRLFIRHQVLLRLGAEIASTQNLHGVADAVATEIVNLGRLAKIAI
jgi:hypothetical protein